MGSKRVLIPVEIKQRELISKLYLALKIVENGHTVFIGSLDLYNYMDQIKPDVYFELSAANRGERLSRVKKLENSGVKTFALDTEGSGFEGSNKFSPRVSEQVLRHVDFYCAWGPVTADIANKNSTNMKTNVLETGNPRFDLLKSPQKKVYSRDARQIADEYGEFILVNTNFSVNRMDLDRQKRSNQADTQKRHKKESQLIGEFISVVGTLSEELPSYNIVVRPHPVEDMLFYKKIFRNNKKIKVKKKGTVRPWIIASDAVIHNGCTTGVTSVILGKPTFAYMPKDICLLSTPNEVSIKCMNNDELIAKIKDSVIHDEKYKQTREQKLNLQRHIANLQFDSAEKISDQICGLKIQKSNRKDRYNEYPSPSIKHRIKKRVVDMVGSDTFGPIYFDHLRAGGDHSFKFSKTTKEDILSIISQFPKSIIPDKIKIEQMSGVVYAFKLYK